MPFSLVVPLLALAVTHYYLLSLVVFLVVTLYYLLHHSLSLDVPLVCLFINDPGFVMFSDEWEMMFPMRIKRKHGPKKVKQLV